MIYINVFIDVTIFCILIIILSYFLFFNNNNNGVERFSDNNNDKDYDYVKNKNICYRKYDIPILPKGEIEISNNNSECNNNIYDEDYDPTLYYKKIKPYKYLEMENKNIRGYNIDELDAYSGPVLNAKLPINNINDSNIPLPNKSIFNDSVV